MWSRNASDGKTYEESIKKTLLDDLKNMALLEEHMKDYDVKLTKADKKQKAISNDHRRKRI